MARMAQSAISSGPRLVDIQDHEVMRKHPVSSSIIKHLSTLPPCQRIPNVSGIEFASHPSVDKDWIASYAKSEEHRRALPWLHPIAIVPCNHPLYYP